MMLRATAPQRGAPVRPPAPDLLPAARPGRAALRPGQPAPRPGRLRGRRHRQQLVDRRRRAPDPADRPARADTSRCCSAYKTFPDDPSDLDELCGDRERPLRPGARALPRRGRGVTSSSCSRRPIGSGTRHGALPGRRRRTPGPHSCGSTSSSTRTSAGWWSVLRTPSSSCSPTTGNARRQPSSASMRFSRSSGLVELRESAGRRGEPVLRRPASQGSEVHRHPERARPLPHESARPAAGARRPSALSAAGSTSRSRGPAAASTCASSLAFSPTDASFAVYVRDGGADQIERIRAALLDVKLDDGRAAIDDVWTPEELYGYPADTSAPTLLFSPALGVRPSTAIKDVCRLSAPCRRAGMPPA